MSTESIWDEIEIGNVPYKEASVNVEDDNYQEISRKEVHEFKKQLIRKFGKKKHAEFLVKKLKQKNGIYYTVVLVYKVNDEDSSKFAFIDVEDNVPDFWDDIAKKNLSSINQ